VGEAGAAVRSMSMSWKTFLFGGFDPAATITIDKTPGAFWLQALSVRAFGFHNWSVALPQVDAAGVGGPPRLRGGVPPGQQVSLYDCRGAA
jgi:4-amino-4-deoxy-L-arabinose transferase-like glycosyltransferase